MVINAVLIEAIDTVATVTREIAPGEKITFMFQEKTTSIKALSHIPVYHKAAVKKIEKGEAVLKYGERIGQATTAINPGEHVHTQNVTSLKGSN